MSSTTHLLSCLFGEHVLNILPKVANIIRKVQEFPDESTLIKPEAYLQAPIEREKQNKGESNERS
jgi:hypothetical protein